LIPERPVTLEILPEADSKPILCGIPGRDRVILRLAQKGNTQQYAPIRRSVTTFRICHDYTTYFNPSACYSRYDSQPYGLRRQFGQ
jgi:hypothetical protein